MYKSTQVILAGLILTFTIAAPAIAAPTSAKAPPKGVKSVAANKIPSGLKPGASFSLDGKTVQFGGLSVGGDSACVCDPACTDGKYCSGCTGCKY
jgi:hypothetical protein